MAQGLRLAGGRAHDRAALPVGGWLLMKMHMPRAVMKAHVKDVTREPVHMQVWCALDDMTAGAEGWTCSFY